MSGLVGTIGAKSGVISANTPIWGPNDIGDISLGTDVTVGGNNSSPDSRNGLWKNDLTGIATCYLALDDFATGWNGALFTLPAEYVPQADHYVLCVCTCWDAAYMCRFYSAGSNAGEVRIWNGDYVGKGEGGRTATTESVIFSHTWLTA